MHTHIKCSYICVYVAENNALVIAIKFIFIDKHL